MSCEAITGCVMVSSTFAQKGRLEDTDGVALQQADISALTYSAWNPSGTQIKTDVALVVADVISDTLLTMGWDEDSTGYNLTHIVEDDVCVVAGEHIFEYRVTLTSGQQFTSRQFKVTAQATQTG